MKNKKNTRIIIDDTPKVLTPELRDKILNAFNPELEIVSPESYRNPLVYDKKRLPDHQPIRIEKGGSYFFDALEKFSHDPETDRLIMELVRKKAQDE